MSSPGPKLLKDRDEVILKFKELIDKANKACEAFKKSDDGTLPGDIYFELRVSSINLLTRLASGDSIYVQELKQMKPNAFAIKGVLERYAKERFDRFMTQKKVSVKPFESFPETITLKQEVPQEFNKKYYEKIDNLKKEELNFIERLDLDTLPNIEFWVRNREKQDPFLIQRWKKGKLYPDIGALTKKGNVVALEWKGEDRISNEDTGYKVAIGEMWEKLGKGKLYFFLVHNGNTEEVLNALKNYEKDD